MILLQNFQSGSANLVQKVRVMLSLMRRGLPWLREQASTACPTCAAALHPLFEERACLACLHPTTLHTPTMSAKAV